MKTSDFDKIFDDNKRDVMDHFDLKTAVRPNHARRYEGNKLLNLLKQSEQSGTKNGN